MTLKMTQKGTYYPIDLPAVEAKYGATYLGYWTINQRDIWTSEPVDVFYQPNPKTELGHSNYFGLYERNGSLFITNAESFCPLDGIACFSYKEELVVSHYRHDMRHSQDGECFADGGRDYLRNGGNGTYGRLFVEDGKFIFISLDGLIPQDVDLDVTWGKAKP